VVGAQPGPLGLVLAGQGAGSLGWGGRHTCPPRHAGTQREAPTQRPPQGYTAGKRRYTVTAAGSDKDRTLMGRHGFCSRPSRSVSATAMQGRCGEGPKAGPACLHDRPPHQLPPQLPVHACSAMMCSFYSPCPPALRPQRQPCQRARAQKARAPPPAHTGVQAGKAASVLHSHERVTACLVKLSCCRRYV